MLLFLFNSETAARADNEVPIDEAAEINAAGEKQPKLRCFFSFTPTCPIYCLINGYRDGACVNRECACWN